MQALARALAATIVLSSLAAAQQPSSDAKQDPLQVTAKLIVVPTVVRDKHGALIKDLTRDSFDLKVDGKPQTVRYFDHDSDVPLTVGLLIDTSMSQREVLGDEQAASGAFLDKMLTPDRDKAFLIQFAADVNLLQDITDSRPKLQEALKQIDGDKPQFGRGHDHSAGMGTTLYDSVFLASDEVLSKQQGRRALILLTDGDDRGSLKTLPKAIEAAQRADTIIYAIYYHSDHDFGGGGYGHHGGGGGGFPGGGGHGGYPGGGGGGYPGHGGGDRSDGKKVLEQMCHETGGQMFEVKGKETVDKIYATIGDELRSQYRLGFTPSAEAASAGYHQIDLTLTGAAAKGKNQVQTRDGYYQK